MEERILVVEDKFEFILEAFYGLDGLGDAKAVSNVNDGLDAVDEYKPTVALLDVNIIGGKSFPIAQKLSELGIPFVFVTAVGHHSEHYGTGLEIQDKNKDVLEKLKSTYKGQEVWRKAYDYAVRNR